MRHTRTSGSDSIGCQGQGDQTRIGNQSFGKGTQAIITNEVAGQVQHPQPRILGKRRSQDVNSLQGHRGRGVRTGLVGPESSLMMDFINWVLAQSISY